MKQLFIKQKVFSLSGKFTGHSIPTQISILEKGNLQEFANTVNDTIAEEVA